MLPKLPLILLAAISLAAGSTAIAAPHAGPLAYRNLFADDLGKTRAETDAKIEQAWQHFFYGNDETQRVYYPVGGDEAYIFDVGNGDVRTEGMSYGLMIAVQLDHRAEFDRLWTWAKNHMYHADGPRHGYFAWHCTRDGTPLDPGSASDGEEWFAMALLFASHRWGDATGAGRGEAGLGSPTPAAAKAAPINYGAEAQALLHAMLDDKRGGDVTAIFSRRQKQVVFAPTRDGSLFTDPSYHLPAFYELWAQWAADKKDRAFWSAVADTSRGFFRSAARTRTGLMPDYANFDGSPRPGDKGDFRFDAWRTLANVAQDYAWFAIDPWQRLQSQRVVAFLASQGPACPNQFSLDGKPLSTDTSIGLLAMAAVAGLVSEPGAARPFVQRLWDAPPPEGQWRYYDGMLYFLGLLQAGGRFQIYGPTTR